MIKDVVYDMAAVYYLMLQCCHTHARTHMHTYAHTRHYVARVLVVLTITSSQKQHCCIVLQDDNQVIRTY